MTTKSARAVVAEALELGAQQFEAYSHASSPHLYTQAQLFACLVLKTFLNFDYRRLEIHLRESPELSKALGLKRVPHFTTFQKATERLLKKYPVAELLQKSMQRFGEGKKKQLNFNFDSAFGV